MTPSRQVSVWLFVFPYVNRQLVDGKILDPAGAARTRRHDHRQGPLNRVFNQSSQTDRNSLQRLDSPAACPGIELTVRSRRTELNSATRSVRPTACQGHSHVGIGMWIPRAPIGNEPGLIRILREITWTRTTHPREAPGRLPAHRGASLVRESSPGEPWKSIEFKVQTSVPLRLTDDGILD